MAGIRVNKGHQVAFAEFAAAPGEKYPLVLKEYSTEADSRTQTYQITLEMAQPEGVNILPGMTATVSKAAGPVDEQHTGQITIPAVAIFSDEAGNAHVWVVNKESMTVHSRKIITGDLSGTDSMQVLDRRIHRHNRGLTAPRRDESQGSEQGGGLQLMNIAELSIRKSVITWVLTILMVVLGTSSFFALSWLEDPEFTIKDAIVMTPYPGASAAEVEEEVTNVLEKAIQQLGQLKYVESRSSRGFSQIKVKIKDEYDKHRLPQVWDELRRKVNDYQVQLPPGAGPTIVNDDFGDVYGIYMAITGEGYTYKELYEFAKFLQRELLRGEDVKKIVLYGVQPEAIYVEMRREKMAQLGVSQQDIYNALAAKNLAVSAGNINLGPNYIPVHPTGEFVSEQEFGDLLVSSSGPSSHSLVYLGDVADIVRGYEEPPTNILRFDRKPAIGLGISTVLGGNVITMGESLDELWKELKPQAPLGMEINVIALQTEAVTSAINGPSSS